MPATRETNPKVEEVNYECKPAGNVISVAVSPFLSYYRQLQRQAAPIGVLYFLPIHLAMRQVASISVS